MLVLGVAMGLSSSKMVKVIVTLSPDRAKDWERPWVCGAPHIKLLGQGWGLTRGMLYVFVYHDITIIV